MPDDGKHLAILFKADDGEQIRQRLRIPQGCLLQFGPKGSYRLRQKLEYFRWLLEDQPVHEPASADVYLLDWFAPNHDTRLHQLLESHGDICLMIPGCTTGHVQVNDLRAHAPYSAHYKKCETLDAWEQLKVRPNKMPSTSRQTVMDRALDAWHHVDHLQVSKGFIEAGVCGNLDGSEDHKLCMEVATFWAELNMSEERKRIGAQVKAEVDAGRLKYFHQYKELLEDYDEHAPEGEGYEARPVAVAAVAEGEDEDEVCTDEDNGEEVSRELADADIDDIIPEPPTEADNVAAAVVTTEAGDQLSDPFQEAAIQSLRSSCTSQSIHATLAGLEAVRTLGGDGKTEELLEARLEKLLDSTKSSQSAARVFLRSRALERQHAEAARRQAAADDDRKLKQLAAEAKVLEHKVALAKVQDKEAVRDMKDNLLALKTKKDMAVQEQVQAKDVARVMALHLAACLLRTCMRHSLVPARATALRAHSEKFRKTGARHVVAPHFLTMPPFRDLQDVTFRRIGEKKLAHRYYASPSFSWELFGRQKQSQCRDPDAIHRFRRLIETSLPGYEAILGPRYPAAQLLASNQNYTDLAYIEANWRYTRLHNDDFPGLRKWPLSIAESLDLLRHGGVDSSALPVFAQDHAVGASASSSSSSGGAAACGAGTGTKSGGALSAVASPHTAAAVSGGVLLPPASGGAVRVGRVLPASFAVEKK